MTADRPIGQVLALLTTTPKRLVELTAGVAPARLQARPDPDEWSANDVLAHLRSCADVWGDCIAAILAEDGTTLRAVNPTTWIEQTNYRDLRFRPSLRPFLAQRTALLAVLEPLPEEAWSRSATVTGAGRPLQRTVLSYAERLAVHERQHLKQVERVINA
jgi:DinB superfamily